MRPWKILVYLSLLTANAWAQEQFALRLNEKGILRTLELALKYNSGVEAPRSFHLPDATYKLSIKKELLLSSPLVSVLNQISDIALDRDLDFFLRTSGVRLTGQFDSKSLELSVSNSTDTSFDLKLRLDIADVMLKGDEIAVCESLSADASVCEGLKLELLNLSLSTKKRPVQVEVVLRVITEGHAVRAKIVSVKTNLDQEDAPHLDIKFDSLNVPRLAIVIEGVEHELDTSRLKDEVLKRQKILAGKLMGLMADFVTTDLVEMVNLYFNGKIVPTKWEMERPIQIVFDELASNRHSIIRRNNVTTPATFLVLGEILKDPIGVIFSEMMKVIKHAQLELEVKQLKSPGKKNLELVFEPALLLNHRRVQVINTLGNTNRPLPRLELHKYRGSDINMAISEPLINGALDLAGATGLFQKIFDALAPRFQGLSINGVKTHFRSNSQITVVVNVAVDLRKLKADGLSDMLKYTIATYLERNNNKSIIYFPVQVDVIPQFKNKLDGSTELHLFVKSPFKNDVLLNDFNYPSNISSMNKLVRNGLMDKLMEVLGEYISKVYQIDISKYFNKSGFELRPKMISIDQAAYLLINLDIEKTWFEPKE